MVKTHLVMIMASRALIFICSLFTIISSYGQIRVNNITLGIDPIRSLTMLLPEQNSFSHKFYYNTCQANAELIFPMRTSFVASVGYTRAHLQELSGTLDYRSHGDYAKFGLNFNMGELTDRRQQLIGWRIGMTKNYTEDAVIVLEGNSWNNAYTHNLGAIQRTVLWGEFIIEEKVRVSMNKSSFLYNMWFSTQLMMRFGQQQSDNVIFKSYNVPGFGRQNPVSPGLSFNLAYYFNFKHKFIYPEQPTHKNRMRKRKYGRVLDYHYE